MQQSIQGDVPLTPGDDSISERVRCGCESAFSIQSQFFGCPSQCGKRVIAVTAGISHGEGIEFALRNLNYGADFAKKSPDFLARSLGQSSFER